MAPSANIAASITSASCRRVSHGMMFTANVRLTHDHHTDAKQRHEEHQVRDRRILVESVGELADERDEDQVEEQLHPVGARRVAVHGGGAQRNGIRRSSVGCLTAHVATVLRAPPVRPAMRRRPASSPVRSSYSPPERIA
jgi:hypothetical protein